MLDQTNIFVAGVTDTIHVELGGHSGSNTFEMKPCTVNRWSNLIAENYYIIPSDPTHYPVSNSEHKAIENNFTYHPPKPHQPEKYVSLRDKAKELAYLIHELCPPSKERSLAITNLEQAIYWANGSIARNE